MNQKQLKELQNHLKCPKGEKGIELGNMMNKSNKELILNSIKALDLKPNQKVLEIGHSNADHVRDIFKIQPKISYFGLETSDTMWKEAKKRNRSFNASFHLYNGINIPFDENLFDRILSTNTIYFWSEPIKMIAEIEQTLKQNGICILTYIEKDFMRNLPFVGEEFTLYNQEDVKSLIATSNLSIISIAKKSETVESKSGDLVERKYTIVRLKK